MPTVRRNIVFMLALFMLCGVGQAVLAETYPPRAASPLTVRQIHSGHSLSDVYGSNPWPGRLILATAQKTGDRAYDTIHRSIIPGGSLRWRWDNPSYHPDARRNISDFELMVITEGVPLAVDPEAFKTNSLDVLDRWELMQDSANANRPAGMPRIYMIPGHRLMMRLK